MRRSFSLVTPEPSLGAYRNGETSVPARNISGNDIAGKRLGDGSEEDKTILRTEYTATTNRMLRVAVNGFMESLGVILDVMKELDLDVLAQNL